MELARAGSSVVEVANRFDRSPAEILDMVFGIRATAVGTVGMATGTLGDDDDDDD